MSSFLTTHQHKKAIKHDSVQHDLPRGHKAGSYNSS